MTNKPWRRHVEIGNQVTEREKKVNVTKRKADKEGREGGNDLK